MSEQMSVDEFLQVWSIFQGIGVMLKLRVRRWRCRSSECRRYIFTERLAGVLASYARQTNRLSEAGTLVGHALGGRAGQRC
jgi:transposase